MHSRNGIGVADEALDGRPGRFAQPGQRLVEHGLRLARSLVLGVDHLVQAMGRVGDEQRELRGPSLRPLGDRLEQRLGSGRLVGHDEHSGGHL